MNRDEIIRMAREAGNGDEDWLVMAKQLFIHFPDEMERFAALVAAAESKKWEAKCDALLNHCSDPECSVCASIICPHGCSWHFHHDGCPACAEADEQRGQA